MGKLEIKKYFSGLSKNTVLLALASLFSDISTEMLYPVLPIFLTQNLKAGGSIVGIIEGIAEATKNIIQGFSGYLSDKIQKRKQIALFGYTLSAVSKPLIGLATVWHIVLGARFFDRLGSGIRSAPRDALIASSVDEKNRGKAFGFEGIGDNLGAFLGPLIAILILYSFRIDIRYIFYLALIPGILSVLMIFLLKEKAVVIDSKQRIDIRINKFPNAYWRYLLVIALFGIGNSSNSFLILQTKNLGVPLGITIFIYAFYNLVATLISYPSGSLSDKVGRKPLLMMSFFIFLISYLGFALTKNLFIIATLFIFYGMYHGIFRSVGKSFAIDFVPQELQASAVGWYSTTVGLTTLVASVVAGQLWDNISHSSVFIFGAFFSLIGILALSILIPNKKIH